MAEEPQKTVTLVHPDFDHEWTVPASMVEAATNGTGWAPQTKTDAKIAEKARES